MKIYHSYVYKIQFEGGFFYIGSRSCGTVLPKDDKYDGSPKTFAQYWNSLKWEKKILKTFKGISRDRVRKRAVASEERFQWSHKALTHKKSFMGHIGGHYRQKSSIALTHQEVKAYLAMRPFHKVKLFLYAGAAILIFLFLKSLSPDTVQPVENKIKESLHYDSGR